MARVRYLWSIVYSSTEDTSLRDFYIMTLATYNALLWNVIATPISLPSLSPWGFQVYSRTLCYENKKNCENIMGNVCNVCKDRKVQVIK